MLLFVFSLLGLLLYKRCIQLTQFRFHIQPSLTACLTLHIVDVLMELVEAAH